MGGVEKCLNVVTFIFYFKPILIKLSYVVDDGNSCKVTNLGRKRHYYKTLGCKHLQRLFSLTILLTSCQLPMLQIPTPST
jgi:hypothetical protein